ncbi:MAG TPA: hypothetical protein VFG50_17500, partial [Rhodothermales bacterium]|nr:hypothetical protein [Rhodothermales bacterium]
MTGAAGLGGGLPHADATPAGREILVGLGETEHLRGLGACALTRSPHDRAACGIEGEFGDSGEAGLADPRPGGVVLGRVGDPEA